MEIVLVTGSGFERRTRLTLSMLRDWHPDAAVTALVCAPRPLAAPPGFDDVIFARDIAPHRGIRFVDVSVGWGTVMARWWAVLGHLESSQGRQLVVPDHAVVSASLAPLADSIAPGSIGLLPRHVGPRSETSTGGWIPEVVVSGGDAGGPIMDWADCRREVLECASAAPDPWSTGPFGPEIVAVPRSFVTELWLLPGVDPRAPWAAPPPDLPTRDDLPSDSFVGIRHRLIAERSAAIQADTDGDGSRWSSDPIASTPLSLESAQSWRGELLAHLSTDSARPPNPHCVREAGPFLDWLTSGGDPEVTGMSRIADEVWRSRPDLAVAMGRPTGSGRAGFTRWMWTHGVNEGLLTLPELPDPVAPRRHVSVVEHPPFGVNLVGYHQAQAGLGVAVRRVAQALDSAGISWVRVDNTRTASRQIGDHGPTGDPLYYFNLMLMAPDQVPGFVDEIGPSFLANRYTIGLWYWESDRLSAAQERGLAYVDEIWGATDYLRHVFTQVSEVPVRRVPIPFTFPEPDRSEVTRDRIGLDERFTFLFSFDFLSVAARKNPAGLVEAYRRAFPEVGEQRLILKSINGSRFPDVRDRLEWQIGDRPDIELWDRYLDSADRLSLVALSDAYVSLHRSEGLGLTIAEAMTLGTPVIASRYSGNLDFTDDASAWLIDGNEILVGPGHHYPADGHWFDPDLDQAARVMRHVVGEPNLSLAKVRAAHRRMAEFSTPGCGAVIEARLRELWTSAARPLSS